MSPCTRPKGLCPLDTQQALPPCTRPSSSQAPYPSLPPTAKARSLRCSSSPHRNRCAGFRRGPQRPPLDTDQMLAALDLAQRACRPLHSRRSPRNPFLPLFSQRRFVPLGTLHAILLRGTYPFRTVILFSSCNVF